MNATYVSIYRILNKLTPEKFDLLKGQLVDSGITSADILKVVIFLLLTYDLINSILVGSSLVLLSNRLTIFSCRTSLH